MARYCTCAICKASLAKPKQKSNGPTEQVEGRRIVLTDGQVLCHWSDRDFREQRSTELAKLTHVVGSEAVCASFFLYDSEADVPAMRPKALQIFGLAGKYRYTVKSDLSKAAIYVKKGQAQNGSEVVVVLGCGGAITYNDQHEAIEVTAGKM